MKAKLICAVYAIAFIIYIGFGWSVVENPTATGIIVAVVYFLALLAGTKIVNRYADLLNK